MRKCFAEFPLVFLHQISHPKKYFKTVIKCQKRLEQIGFRPKDPEGGVGEVDFLVFVRKRNIVEMNDNPGSQTREYFQNQKIDVASGAYGMAGINKKKVVLSQILKKADVHEFASTRAPQGPERGDSS
jgi:hypothetical protein